MGVSLVEPVRFHIPHDLVITEIVDPEPGRPVPTGTPGEVVYTNLVGDTRGARRPRPSCRRGAPRCGPRARPLELLPLGTLPRSEGRAKMRRVGDTREKRLADAEG